MLATQNDCYFSHTGYNFMEQEQIVKGTGLNAADTKVF